MDADRIVCVQGNIVLQDVDAIVNAANPELAEGAGVCGAVFAAAGPELHEACRRRAPCPTGEARITDGFRLPARHVIHAVGPVHGACDGREDELLASAYRSSLELCDRHACRSVAFPAISTGIYGFPPREAAVIAIGVVRGWLTGHSRPERVVFVLFTPDDLELYRETLGSASGPS
ncbi:MAG TPA: macro domain-containing protein [bacterium]|nr:macro domain-containing protein [bacterium]